MASGVATVFMRTLLFSKARPFKLGAVFMHQVLYSLLLIVLLGFNLVLSGCVDKQNVVTGKAVAELNAKAQALLQQGQTEDAVARLESAYDLNPEQLDTLRNLAIAYQANGQYQEAADKYRLLAEKDTANAAQWLQSLGIALEEDADSLKTQFLDAQQKEGAPVNAEPPSAANLPEPVKAKYQQAIIAFRKAIELQPPNREELKAHVTSLEKELSGEQPVL